MSLSLFCHFVLVGWIGVFVGEIVVGVDELMNVDEKMDWNGKLLWFVC